MLTIDQLPPEKTSWKQVLAALPAKKQEEFLKGFSNSELNPLQNSYFLNARREQFAPLDDLWFLWIIMTGRGWGKALDIKTPILTGEGWKFLEDIKDGDVVFDEKGNPCLVLKAHDVLLNRKCYEVAFSDGAKVICDEEHLWTVFIKNEKKTLTTKEIKVAALVTSLTYSSIFLPQVESTSLLIKRQKERTFEGIEEVESRPVRCLTVDSESSLYLCSEYLVPTHNTYTGANWISDGHLSGILKNSCIVAATSSDLRRYCIEGPSGILSVAPSWFIPEYKPAINKLIWPNGTITSLHTSEKPERLRGPNYDGAWCDELSYWRYVNDAWDNLMFCLRYGKKPRCVITMTPRPIKLVLELIKREDARITRGSLYENSINLSAEFIKVVEDRYGGTRLGRQEIAGELLEDVEGALWSHELLDKMRLRNHPTLTRIGIGVDPATTSGEKADETGIIIGGRSRAKECFILDDYSLKGTPDEWGGKVAEAYERYEADFVVAEKNQGGEMVKAVIHHKNKNIPVKLVHASKGKIARAEPVSAIYEQGKVHHIGSFPELEKQMCYYVPGEVTESPDRMDALVYLITELIIKAKGRAGTWGRKIAA